MTDVTMSSDLNEPHYLHAGIDQRPAQMVHLFRLGSVFSQAEEAASSRLVKNWNYP